MNYVVILPSGFDTQVIPISYNQTAQSIALQSGVTDPSLYQEFPESDFDAACYNFPGAFTLTAGVVGFDLPEAKILAQRTASVVQAAALSGYTAEVLASQATLAEVDRIPAIQTAISSVNVLAVSLQAQLDAIDAATTIDEVNNIVNPPGAISGQLQIARSNNDLTDAFYNTLTGTTAENIQLKLMPTLTTLDFNPIIMAYPAAINGFTTGNYQIQLIYGTTVIGSFTVTDNGTFMFYDFSYTP